jgi:hypothetical protein
MNKETKQINKSPQIGEWSNDDLSVRASPTQAHQS